MQMFTSGYRIVVLCKRCHSKALSAVSSVKLARVSFQAVYAPQSSASAGVREARQGEIRTPETEGCATLTRP